MDILLLGRDTSITNTIMEMLSSVEAWSVTQMFSIDKAAAKTSKKGFYDLVVANLTDFSPPPTQIVSKIKIHFPSSNLLVLYSYNQELLIKPLLEAGADGYLQNGISEDELFEAVETVTDGEQFIGVNPPIKQ
jgi:DNA-binding NarL/FixJ family response regulator